MKIRLPADLKDMIERAANANRRSLNAEVVARLQQTFAEMASSHAPLVPFDSEKVDPQLRAVLDSLADLKNVAEGIAKDISSISLPSKKTRKSSS